MLPELNGSQPTRGIVTIQRDGTSPISLSARKDEKGVHFNVPGPGAQEITLATDVLFEFTPDPKQPEVT